MDIKDDINRKNFRLNQRISVNNLSDGNTKKILENMFQVSRNIKYLQAISNKVVLQNAQFHLFNFQKFDLSTINKDETTRNINKGTGQQQNQHKNQENQQMKSNFQRGQYSEEYTKQNFQNNIQGNYINLKQPLPEFTGDRNKLAQWFYNKKNYTTHQNQEDLQIFRQRLIKEFEQLNDECQDINQAFNIYIKLFILLKTVDPKFLAQRFEFIIQRIKYSPTDEEALYYLVVECLKYLRNQNIQKQVNLPIFLILRLTLHICYKFNFLKILQECNQIKQLPFMIEDMVCFVYDFHTNKLLKKINHERIHDMYDKVISLCHKIHYEPSYQFALTNLSMLSDIKQLNKQTFQKLKIHNTIYYRLCLQEIDRCIRNTSDTQIVYIAYKLSTIDYTSFGYKIDHIWDFIEERFYQKSDQYNLIMQKSLLYSIGKTIRITQTSQNLYKKLFDKKQLNKLRYQKNFLEYFSNLLLSGTARSLFTKEQLQNTLPYIQELLEDESLDRKEKIDFVGNTCLLFYRLGIYDKSFWDYFLKYEDYYLNDKSKFFQVYFISRTMPVISDEIDNKELVNRMAHLLEKIKELPYYQQELARISSQITQVKQSLFEQRFDFYANAFGKIIQREKIIDDIFSADFYMKEDNIVIEIEGHNHYNQLTDGTYQMNLITQFKSKYLKKLGISVIHLGVHDCTQQENQMISILRVFLKKYNQVKKHQEENKLIAIDV
ncbi:hypothetical protein TTHERM_00656000 (macronuclear) [Tetrahymena thermophila SB210]|uniref:RAP domain protein n=1 Tax=Tetrahymena thermophila (strain SB210) TaxID=312017 RepID=Q22GV6_TETTS|nr:hypothetical protein TTHERM_00656000 [Tetrahymena thermophila SB210]EAR84568.2 hypothetical protein TTHERM_00656000 [Tetrahymena thermophila SB210]|eukprot:XP_001032231.2 hypothetical protein TTHERM_00656000 [Tetrahymena thermophila SB210]